jgi:hypothetical protein
MLYIIDNGEQWSDHKIYFVVDPGYTREEIEALLVLFTPPHLIDVGEQFTILGHGKMEWFEGKLTTFEKLMDDLDWRLSGWDDENRFAGRKHAALMPEALRNLLPRFLKEQWYAGKPELPENAPPEEEKPNV